MNNIKKVATRDSYGNALKEIGAEVDNLIVMDADLAGATKTVMFKNEFPDHFLDSGIAESNMVGVAAGLSTMGFVPFISTFAMFIAGRGYEQLRNTVGYPHLNVKVGATHGGISVGEDGASHQCLEDFALMRTIPGMTVMCPSDDVEARQMVKAAYELDGPVYIRFGRAATPVFHEEDYQFEIGKGEVLQDGKDVTLIATGILVPETIETVKKLEEDGISVRLINMSTIKPIDTDLIIESAYKTGKIITIEEHNVIGGLGSAVSEVLVENNPVPMKRIGVKDRFGKSGPAEALLAEYQLDANGIYEQVKEYLS